MRQAITIAFDADGQPALLADPRTPVKEQERSMQLLKAGFAPAPEGMAKVQLVVWDTVPTWIRTIAKPSVEPVEVPPPVEPAAKPTTTKKGKSK